MVKVLFLFLVCLVGFVGCGKKESRFGEVSTPKPKMEEPLPEDPEERHKVAYIRAAQAFSRNDLEGALISLDIRIRPSQSRPATQICEVRFTLENGIGSKRKSRFASPCSCSPIYQWLNLT